MTAATPSPTELIWILDNDPSYKSLYQETLGLQYSVRPFETPRALLETLLNVTDNEPRLLIVDPQRCGGSLTTLFADVREQANGQSKLLEYVVVSNDDDLDLIRFYLKSGARDYLLKPLNASELVAKIERALHQINKREISLLRNDIDGAQVSDLTLREHQLLTIFLSRPNRAVSRDELYGAIWNKKTVNKKTLDVHLFNLRRKLRPFGYDITWTDPAFVLGKLP